MSPIVEQWFVTCLFVLGPQGTRTEGVYITDAERFFRDFIPNGSGCGWYAHWYVAWVEQQRKARRGN